MNEITLSHRKKLAYLDIGNAPRTLVCLSGLGCDHYNFEWIQNELSKDFRLIIIDNRGMGESEDWQEAYYIRDLARDTLELLDALEIRTFGVIGISMGGFVAQELVQLAPGRLSSVAFLCTTSGGDEFHALPILTDESFRKVAQMGAAGDELAVRATVDINLPTKNSELFHKIVALRTAHPYRLDQVLLQNRAAALFLARKLSFEHFKAPVLVLHGANDRFVRPENAEILASKFKHSFHSLIPEGDHLFFLEKSEQVASELNNFFNKQWEKL